MPKKTLSLIRQWDHQNEATQHLMSAPSTALVAIPTGGGKTMAIKCATFLHKAPIRILVTVSKDVEEAFKEAEKVQYTDNLGVSHILDFTGAWLCPRDESEENTQVLLDYLANPQGRILITTHAQFRMWKESIPKNTKGWLLVVDEIHHSGKFYTLLAKLCQKVQAGGGQVWGATATPDRNDGRDMFYEPNVARYTVPYTRLVTELDFPENIEFNLQEVKAPALDSSGVPSIINYISIAKFIAMDKLPTVLYIAPGDSGQVAQEFKQALIHAGVPADRILDAVNDPTEFFLRLKAERNLKDYRKSTIQVIIACKRMTEASDWPACCNIVTLGVTDSLLLLLQRLGRALRCKAGMRFHPSPNTSNITMFVGDISSLDTTKEKAFAAQLLNIACHLQMHSVALTYARMFSDLVKGLRMPPVLRTHLVSTLNLVGNDRLREARKTLISLYHAHGFQNELEIISGIQHNPTLTKDKKIAALLDILYLVNPQDAELRAKFNQSVARVINKVQEDEHYQKDATVRPHLIEDLLYLSLLELAEDFAGKYVQPETLGFSSGVSAVLTPQRILTAVSNLDDARSKVNPYTTLEEILNNVITPYFTQYNTYPTLASGVQDITQFMQRDSDAHIRYSLRDLEMDIQDKGLTIEKLSAIHLFRVMQGSNISLSEVKTLLVQPHVANAVRVLPDPLTMPDADFRNHLRKTHHLSRFQVQMSQGKESLVALELALQFGWRGLPKGLSLLSL